MEEMDPSFNVEFGMVNNVSNKIWEMLLDKHFPLAQRFHIDPKVEYEINARTTTVYNIIFSERRNNYATIGLSSNFDDYNAEIKGLPAPRGTWVWVLAEKTSGSIGFQKSVQIFKSKEDILADVNEWAIDMIDNIVEDVVVSIVNNEITDNTGFGKLVQRIKNKSQKSSLEYDDKTRGLVYDDVYENLNKHSKWYILFIDKILLH